MARSATWFFATARSGPAHPARDLTADPPATERHGQRLLFLALALPFLAACGQGSSDSSSAASALVTPPVSTVPPNRNPDRLCVLAQTAFNAAPPADPQKMPEWATRLIDAMNGIRVPPELTEPWGYVRATLQELATLGTQDEGVPTSRMLELVGPANHRFQEAVARVETWYRSECVGT